ncbi:MAG TPA: hypothetical protein VI462_11930 [Acidimicrobiia bacterium]
MPTVRFNHMELTFAPGTLDEAYRADVAAFYGDLFGWQSANVEVVGQQCQYLRVDDGQFILLAESPKPMSSPGYDHLGLLCDTRAEVDELLGKVLDHQRGDDRVRVKEYEDLVTGNVTVHAFYVKYLLPIFFDVQCMEWQPGSAPTHRWHYATA